MVPLSKLPLGGRGRVVEVGGDRAFRRRLMELGVLPGTPVRLIRTAPLGDPLVVEVRGGQLSLRRREAQAVVVEPAP